MLDGLRGFEQLFSPPDRLVLVDPKSNERGVDGDGGGGVQITVVGGPAERGTQVGQLDVEPGVGLALSRAVPQGEYFGFPAREVTGVGGPDLISLTAGDELVVGE